MAGSVLTPKARECYHSLVVLATHVDQALRGGEAFDISVDLICARKIGGGEALDRPFMQTPPARLRGKRANWLVILFWGGAVGW